MASSLKFRVVLWNGGGGLMCWAAIEPTYHLRKMLNWHYLRLCVESRRSVVVVVQTNTTLLLFRMVRWTLRIRICVPCICVNKYNWAAAAQHAQVIIKSHICVYIRTMQAFATHSSKHDTGSEGAARKAHNERHIISRPTMMHCVPFVHLR